MTFTTRIKEEAANLPIDRLSALPELSAFIRYDALLEDGKITLVIENGAVARRIYKLIKELYSINVAIIIRNQKRFRVKQIYILEITTNVDKILENLNIIKDNKRVSPDNYFLDTTEDKVAFIRGLFLACGSVSDPATSGYHLEFVVRIKEEALFIQSILSEFKFNSKVLKRSNRYMVYLKNAEEISDVIKMFNAINSLFYFEDIRIYRDHKNMVNRLTNCEIANQEKTIKAGLEQLENIKYIKNNDLVNLLDERTQIIMNYRQKYPDVTLAQLADIISMETDKKISKSGVNHAFIKIRDLVKRHKQL